MIDSNRTRVRRGLAAAVLACAVSAACAATAPEYDLVIAHARAMDPETGLDGIRNIGIRDGVIEAISEQPLQGRRVLDADGQVAAPGFIDLHSHATTYETATYQAMDGVTTRLELEIGVWPVKQWYQRFDGKALINYGASVGQLGARAYLQLGGDQKAWELVAGKAGDTAPTSRTWRDADIIRKPIPDDQYARFIPLMDAGLKEGGIGLGSGTQYAPGITYREMYDLTKLAGDRGTCVYTHIRYGSLVEPDSTLEAVQENIANAAVTGGCVHIVHINSMAMGQSLFMLQLMHAARERGIDVSTEAYPWDASNDSIRSVIFEPGWEQRWGVQPEDLQSRETGKRLSRADFDALRNGTDPDGVLMHMNTEDTLQGLFKDPLVLVASDALDIVDDKSHPRSAGTFSRMLGHYVRETHTLSLMEALRKMSLMPAQRLEAFTPEMKKKGRLQVGADADIVVFDPDTVQEQAAYLHAKRYSKGFRYVMVNGTLVVDQGHLVEGIYPGQPVYSKYKQ